MLIARLLIRPSSFQQLRAGQTDPFRIYEQGRVLHALLRLPFRCEVRLGLCLFAWCLGRRN